MSQRPTVEPKTAVAFALEWSVISASLIAAVNVATWWAYALAFVVVATRQHGLLMLYHDGVHGHVARTPALNDFLVNLFVGVPHVIPVEIYRPLHLEHHRGLGTEADPERRLLYAGQPWNYRPLPKRRLLQQLAGDLLFVNGLRTMVAWRRGGGLPAVSAATLLPIVIWIGLATMLASQWPARAAVAALIWFGALLTLTNLLQKLRSFAEHSAGPGVTPGWDDWTYTWRIGWLGRLTIWPYHINLHQEHHARPGEPWHRLPRIAAGTPAARRGASLWTLLMRRKGAAD